MSIGPNGQIGPIRSVEPTRTISLIPPILSNGPVVPLGQLGQLG